MAERQLWRIRNEVARSGGEPPRPKSRRPCKPGELAEKIQRLIEEIELSGDSRDPYGPMDVKRILEKNYKEKLLKYHGTDTISLSTVSKYMAKGVSGKTRGEKEHPRGSYIYPEPFQQVVIDTSYFKVFGVTYYLITVFEMAGRLNLLTRVVLRENAQVVVAILQDFLLKYPGVEVVVIDRGTPYLNEEVKGLLENDGRFRIVCPPASPTAKAACERHFRTLKDVLRPALERVFPQDPCLEPERMVKLLEMGASVFQELYHRIPQEGIDGKTPAERAANFDPVRACACMVDLFQRSLQSEPADEYAREIHTRFQLPGRPEDTVDALKRFGTPCLRKLVAEVAPYMDPPLRSPKIYDPLGLLVVKAREIWQKDRAAFYAEKAREPQAERTRQRLQEEAEKFEAEEKERKEHPERFVDGALKLYATHLEKGWAVQTTGMYLRALLVSLSKQLNGAFLLEVERLRGKIAEVARSDRVREALERFLDDCVGEWRVADDFS
jgi:hypothetical protein